MIEQYHAWLHNELECNVEQPSSLFPQYRALDMGTYSVHTFIPMKDGFIVTHDDGSVIKITIAQLDDVSSPMDE